MWTSPFEVVGPRSACLALTLSVAAAAEVSCAQCSPHGRDAGAPTSFRVSALPSSGRITPDGRLDEWSTIAPVASISPGDAAVMQWSCIRGERPKRITESDFAATVYMAWDALRWYIAVDVSDDVVRGAPPHVRERYSGDAFEVFFAGAELDSTRPLHALVAAPSRPDQAAFLQLVLSPETHALVNNHVPDYRTDANILSFLQSATAVESFAVASRRTASGWSAEAAIPLEAFGSPVRTTLAAGGRLRMNLNYLDYDADLPLREAPHWGYKPDHVFCLDDDEEHVTVPKYMRPLVFER